MLRAFKAVPSLAVAMGLGIAGSLVGIAQTLRDPLDRAGAVSTALMALWLAASAVRALAFGELAGRLYGRAATGARIAAAGSVVVLVVQVFGYAAMLDRPDAPRDRDALAYASMIVGLLPIAGLAVAAWERRAIAIAAAIVAALPISLGTNAIVGWFTPDNIAEAVRVTLLVHGVIGLVHGVAFAVLAGATSPGPASTDERRGARGLRWMANAMWARCTLGALAVLPLMGPAMGLHYPAHAMDAIVAAHNAFECIVMAALGAGAFAAARALRVELANGGAVRWLFPLAGAAALWCAAALLDQALFTYQVLYGAGAGDDFALEMARPVMDALPLFTPLVAAAVLAVLVAATRAWPSPDVRPGFVLCAAFGGTLCTYYGSDGGQGLIVIGFIFGILAAVSAAGAFGKASSALAQAASEREQLPAARITTTEGS